MTKPRKPTLRQKKSVDAGVSAKTKADASALRNAERRQDAKDERKAESRSARAEVATAERATGETSREVARVAARALRHPEQATDDEVQSIAASALTQVEVDRSVAEHAPEMLNDPVVASDLAGLKGDEPIPQRIIDGPIVAAVVEPVAAAPDFVADPAADAKLIAEMVDQVRSAVIYHFTSPSEAAHYAEVARRPDVVGINGRPYLVAVSGNDVTVSLG